MMKLQRSDCMNPADEHDMLQLMRGFAILLVVLQHSVVLYFNTNASIIFISICVFIDVHIFMFVSGYLFQKYAEKYLAMGIKQFAVKKFKALIVPYLFWSGLLFFGTYLLYILSDRFGIHAAEALGFQRLSLTQIFVGLLTYRYFYVQLYWFLFALFWVFVINYALFRYSCRPEFMILFFVLFSVLAVFSKSDDYILTKIGRSFVTFGMGRLFQKYRPEMILFKNTLMKGADVDSAPRKYVGERCENPLNQRFLKSLTALIVSVVAFYLVFKVSVWEGNEYFYKVFFSFRLTLMGMIGIIIFFIVSSLLLLYRTKLTGIIMALGDYSLPIYLLHNPWIVHGSNMVLKKISFVPHWLGTAVSLMLGLAVPVLLYRYVIKKHTLLSRIMLGM